MGHNQWYYDMGVSEKGVLGTASHGRSNWEDDELLTRVPKASSFCINSHQFPSISQAFPPDFHNIFSELVGSIIILPWLSINDNTDNKNDGDDDNYMNDHD